METQRKKVAKNVKKREEKKTNSYMRLPKIFERDFERRCHFQKKLQREFFTTTL